MPWATDYNIGLAQVKKSQALRARKDKKSVIQKAEDIYRLLDIRSSNVADDAHQVWLVIEQLLAACKAAEEWHFKLDSTDSAEEEVYGKLVDAIAAAEADDE